VIVLSTIPRLGDDGHSRFAAAANAGYVTLAITALAAASFPAHACSAWSAPETVRGSISPDVSVPSLSFAASGRAVLSWQTGILRNGTSSPAYRTERAAPSSFHSPLRDDGLATAPATYGKTRLATLNAQPDGDRTELRADLGTLTGFSGSNRVLQLARTIGLRPALASNGSGDIVAAWTVSVGDHDHLNMSLRHPGNRFGARHTIRGSGRISDLVAAYGARGDTVIAYQRAHRTSTGRTRYAVEARLRRAGHNFGSARVLGPSRGSAQIAVAIAPTGRAYVVWAEQDGGEEANEPLHVYSTVAGPTHFLFNQSRLLQTSLVKRRPQGSPHVEVDSAGNATAAWSMPTGSEDGRIEIAYAKAGRRIGRPSTLAPSGILQDLAVNRAGAAVVVWTGAYPPIFMPRPLQATYRAPKSDAFGAAEDVAPHPEDPRQAVAAFDADGRAVVAWIGRPGYTGDFPPTATSALRISQRDG
jgi:hypothetical protein